MAEEGGRGKGEERGFKVEDRRRFSPETGEPRESAERAGTSGDHANETAGEESVAQDVPEITFSAFIISLSTQALMHLGEIPNPLSGEVEKEISVAKQMIDIIGLLQDKTRGNLDQGESKLIEDILFDLRMRYVEAVKTK